MRKQDYRHPQNQKAFSHEPRIKKTKEKQHLSLPKRVRGRKTFPNKEMLALSTSRILVNGTVKGKNFAFYRKKECLHCHRLKSIVYMLRHISNRVTGTTARQAGKGTITDSLECQLYICTQVSFIRIFLPINDEEPLKNLDQGSIMLGGKEICYEAVIKVQE